MSVLSDIKDYAKFLTTTKLTLVELNMIIKKTEIGMSNDNWQVHIIGSRAKIRKIRLVLDDYPDNGNGNGNGGDMNGLV